MNGSSAEGRLEIVDRDLHVWAVRLEASEDQLEQCRMWLSDDEKARASRFRFEKHRRAFIFGRGVLRFLLGGMLGLPAAEIAFCYGAKGKPTLADIACPLRFNVSNSGDLAVYGFTLALELGIDVEQIRTILEIADIANRFFARDEVAELMSLPEEERLGGFFSCWTRKEAYIKSVGDGLSVPLDSFCVSLKPGDVAQMLHLGGSVEAAQNWSLHDMRPAAGYVGALAYPDRPRPLVIHPLITAGELLQGA